MSRIPGGTRKRELTSDTVQPAKKSRTEPRTLPDGRFKKRKLEAVLEELCMRVENNDRQLTNNLIRELDSEHVRVVDDEKYEESCSTMIKTCISAKIDTVATKVFNCLVSMFTRGSHQRRKNFILSLTDEAMAEALFSKQCLDSGLLTLYTTVLNDGLITADQVPERVQMTARRSLAHTSLSSTANRTSAVDFIVAISIAEKSNTEKMKTCETMLCRLSADRDYRVRKSVSEGLLNVSLSGFKLAKSTYKIAKAFMKDVDSSVRIMAVRLLIYFANRKGKETIEGKGTPTLTDDAFSSICDAMNDIEIPVRVEAAKKLGDFTTVSEDLIYQTLDKKMMRSTTNAQVVKVQQSLFALSKKASSKNVDRRWAFNKKASYKPEQSNSGGWSRGKELHSAAPEKKEGEKEEEEDSIIPQGACGAFVSALEDEFMDVRKAAVYSLGRLAASRPAFAVSALEYLADMFNDEIADVRLDAINALTPLISHSQLNTDQLNVILKCLDDGMPESRQAMRELLKRAQFTDVSCLEMCVKALLACLKRFPKDKEQVLSCMAEIGKNHAIQVQSIMRSLLDIHLVFDTREPSVEDLEYVGKLVMVLNAASERSSMVYMMPEFVLRHYRFLRSSFPGLIKPIRIIDEQQNGKIRKIDERSNEKAEEIVLKTYSRLRESTTYSSLSERNIKRDDIFRDTSAISTYNENVSGAARLIFCLGEIESAVDSAASTVLQGGEAMNVKQLTEQTIRDMQSVIHQFSGISDEINSYLVHCRMYLKFLDLLVYMMQIMVGQEEIINQAGQIITECRQLLSANQGITAPLSAFIDGCQALFYPLLTVGIEDKRKIITPGGLGILLEKSAPILPPKFPPVPSLRIKHARITSPHKDTAIENVLRFFANLPHGVPLEFELYNVTDVDSVRIKTVYPDGKTDVMKPRSEEFHKENNHLAVATQVKITCATAWSEAAEIDIIIGVLASSGDFVPLFASPSCFSPAHIRVRIHPHSR